MISSNINRNIVHATAGFVPVFQDNCKLNLSIEGYLSKVAIISAGENRIVAKQKNTTHVISYLSIGTVRKMLHKFLTSERIKKDKSTKMKTIRPKYSKEELAMALNISVEKLETILFSKSGYTFISKINLDLIKLYCGTKFI